MGKARERAEEAAVLLPGRPAPDLPPLAVALGVFDGVHRGHQALLAAVAAKAAEAAEAAEAAPEEEAFPAALTFHPHPAAVFSPSRTPPLLTTVEQRAALLRAHGAEIVIVARFDRVFAALTADAFVRDLLVEKLRARRVVVGDDYHYGCNRTGTVPSLRAAGERHGFTVTVIPPLLQGGVPVRSSVIRGMVEGGAVEEAARFLGRPYTLSGIVAAGRQMGRTIGFPTANLSIPEGLCVPGEGVYAGRVQVRGLWHRAAVSVGTNPTVVEAGARTVEAYLLDGFDVDIYDEEIAVEFIAFLRAQERFESLDALVEQMNRDVAEAQRRISRS